MLIAGGDRWTAEQYAHLAHFELPVEHKSYGARSTLSNLWKVTR